MGPLLPGGISLTVKRVPFGGGGVPSRRAPMSSAFSPIGMSAGLGAPPVRRRRVDQDDRSAVRSMPRNDPADRGKGRVRHRWVSILVLARTEYRTVMR